MSQLTEKQQLKKDLKEIRQTIHLMSYLENTLKIATFISDEATGNPEAASALHTYLHNSQYFSKLLKLEM